MTERNSALTPRISRQPDLLTCPFCGEWTVQIYRRGALSCAVRCDNCKAERVGITPELAAEAWNMRASDKTLKAAEKAILRAISVISEQAREPGSRGEANTTPDQPEEGGR